jgi:hypothetical protein
MTKEEALDELEQMLGDHRNRDTEIDHIRADEILCEMLCQCGMSEIVEAFRLVDKWYA